MILRTTSTYAPGKPVIARVIVVARRSCYVNRKGDLVREDGDTLYVKLDDVSTPLAFERKEIRILNETKNPLQKPDRSPPEG